MFVTNMLISAKVEKVFLHRRTAECQRLEQGSRGKGEDLIGRALRALERP